MPLRQVRGVGWFVGAGTEELVVSLHDPHQVHGVGAAWKPCVDDVVADRLGAGETFLADSGRAGAMLCVRHPVRHGPHRIAVAADVGANTASTAASMLA